MTIDITSVEQNIDDYKAVLRNPDLKYWVPEEKAIELTEGLENAIENLCNNYMNGTEVCPYSNLGQEEGADGYASIRNLRMLRYEKWLIVFMVFQEHNLISVTKLVHQGYPIGNSISRRRGDGLGYHFEGKQSKNPIQECLLWMVKLGCFDQYQVESLKERGIL